MSRQAQKSMTEDQKEEQHAYESGRDIFYGLMFGVIPEETAKEIVDDLKETFGTDDITEQFYEHYAIEEGWETLQNIKDLVIMIKAMKTQKNRDLFMATCPNKFLKGFLKEHIKGEHTLKKNPPFKFL